MIGQATEVETQPWATATVIAAAGPPETWPRREWVGPGLALAVPAGWRAQPLDQHHFVVANYDMTSPGLLVLNDELFRADLFWSSFPSAQAPPFSVQALREGYYNKHVSEIQIGGVTGAVLADPVTPLCEAIVLPHDAPGVRGQLWTCLLYTSYVYIIVCLVEDVKNLSMFRPDNGTRMTRISRIRNQTLIRASR